MTDKYTLYRNPENLVSINYKSIWGLKLCCDWDATLSKSICLRIEITLSKLFPEFNIFCLWFVIDCKRRRHRSLQRLCPMTHKNFKDYFLFFPIPFEYCRTLTMWKFYKWLVLRWELRQVCLSHIALLVLDGNGRCAMFCYIGVGLTRNPTQTLSGIYK